MSSSSRFRSGCRSFDCFHSSFSVGCSFPIAKVFSSVATRLFFTFIISFSVKVASATSFSSCFVIGKKGRSAVREGLEKGVDIMGMLVGGAPTLV